MMWSRIQETELATEAHVLMRENEINGCEYHTVTHVHDMYAYLESVDEPYDAALDWAIMFHDAVYDDQPEKEQRSADLFLRWSNVYRGCDLSEEEKQRVCSLIMHTVKHSLFKDLPIVKGAEAMIRADLHALADRIAVVNNFVMIMNESINLYGCSIDEFAENNIQFMEGLWERVILNLLVVDNKSRLFYDSVIEGIKLTIRLAQAIKG
jgi:predicted metal-dependent HD superfamily phosphohydrolase